MADNKIIKRALISVSNKKGVVELGQQLQKMGVEIISTGGTLKTLKDAGVQVISISSFTGSPEILDGRVKTLHPKVHSGILFRRDDEAHVDQMSKSDYKSIDLVVVNLYPFIETVARENATHEEIIENIDIGGPSMIRSAAKNHNDVTVVVDPDDYNNLIDLLDENEGETTLEFRQECAKKAFALTSFYDTAIAEYFISGKKEKTEQFSESVNLNLKKKSSLRYGENPHQDASVYSLKNYNAPSLLNAEILSGKELSYNNYGDLDAALNMLLDFEEPFACVLKHANPCGAAIGSTIAKAYKEAYESDPLSAFGCIIGLNKEVDLACAEVLHETPFVECMLAPSFTEDAFKLLKKKKSRRLLALPSILDGHSKNQIIYKYISGGFLLQTADNYLVPVEDLKVVTNRKPTDEEIKSLMFGWKVVKHTKSNAIVLAKGNATVGVGMGQTSRVDSGFMAVKRAGDRAKGAVMASDAFFPMADGLEVAAEAGVTAVIQPGGSKGDNVVIEAANKFDVAMVFTGNRHFKH